MFFKKRQKMVFLVGFSAILRLLSVSSLFCMQSRDQFFLDLTLNYSDLAFDKIYDVAFDAKARMRTFEAAAFSYDSLKAVVSECEVNCPVFLLGEYMNRRLLSRFAIEGRVSSLLAKLNNIKHRPVEYVNFGATGYFMDFIIAAKVLSQKPNATLSIHLIDSNFTDYVLCRASFGSSRVITKDDDPCFVKIMFLSAEFAKESLGQEYPYSARKDHALLKNCFMIEEGARQFISFFKRMFPRANLSLCLHESMHGYFEYITRQKLSPADVTDTSVSDCCDLFEKLTLH